MPIQSEFRSRAAGERGFLYALLAHAWCYPDELWLAHLLNHAACGAAAEEEPAAGPEVQAATREMLRTCALFRQSPADEVLAALQAAHTRLFGHSVRGTCPPYELEYGRSEIIQQTAELADLAGFYQAFGMGIREDACERVDHISAECEFMSVLCAKEAWGLGEAQPMLAEMCSDARRLFLRDHLARWLPAFAHRVRAADADGFHGRAAALAAALIAAECQALDIEMGPQLLELRPADPAAETVIDCGAHACGGVEDGSADPADRRLVQLGIPATTGQADDSL